MCMFKNLIKKIRFTQANTDNFVLFIIHTVHTCMKYTGSLFQTNYCSYITIATHTMKNNLPVTSIHILYEFNIFEQLL